MGARKRTAIIGQNKLGLCSGVCVCVCVYVCVCACVFACVYCHLLTALRSLSMCDNNSTSLYQYLTMTCSHVKTEGTRLQKVSFGCVILTFCVILIFVLIFRVTLIFVLIFCDIFIFDNDMLTGQDRMHETAEAAQGYRTLESKQPPTA